MTDAPPPLVIPLLQRGKEGDFSSPLEASTSYQVNPGHTHEKEDRQEDGSECRAEKPEMGGLDVSASIPDRTGSRSVRGQDPHEPQTQAQEQIC